jgi:hypothetical protein
VDVCFGPTGATHAGRLEQLQIDPFNQGRRIVHVDPKSANSAVDLGMPEQKSNSAQVT